ncbi:MAG: hypothetical protein LBE21_10625 [Pseudomonadales bacterium]|jgi:hypothetical protein|nr:hypothetical protein [Pseudomonadales bacterium]
MAFDFVVGKSNKAKDSPDVVGSIDFRELPALGRLCKRIDSPFLQKIHGFFDDQEFSLKEVEQTLSQLLPFLTEELPQDQQDLLHKLIAVLAYAERKQYSLYGVAD